MRADGEADADFARPFGHAHEHDVHDADAADDQRDAGDRAEQQGHDTRSGGGGFGDFLLVAHREIVVAAFADVVPLAQERNDLLLRRARDPARSPTCTFMLRKVVPPVTRFIALVYGMITTSSWSVPCVLNPFERQDAGDDETARS